MVLILSTIAYPNPYPYPYPNRLHTCQNPLKNWKRKHFAALSYCTLLSVKSPGFRLLTGTPVQELSVGFWRCTQENKFFVSAKFGSRKCHLLVFLRGIFNKYCGKNAVESCTKTMKTGHKQRARHRPLRRANSTTNLSIHVLMFMYMRDC